MDELKNAQNFSSDAYFMPGSTTWNGITGTLVLLDSKLSFTDDNSRIKFQLDMGSIDVVDFHNPGLIVIKTKSSEKYRVFPTVQTIGIQRSFYTVDGVKNAKEWERVLAEHVSIIPCTGTPRSSLVIFFGVIVATIVITLALVILLYAFK